MATADVLGGVFAGGVRPILVALVTALVPVARGQDRPPSAPTVRDDQAARILELEARNAELLRRVQDLQAQLDRLRGASGQSPTEAAPLDPFSCPAALLTELKYRYARSLGDLPRDSSAARERFDSQAEKWCEKTRAEVRARTRWLVLVTDVRTPEIGSPDALIRVIDEFTHRPLGEAVRVPIRRAIADRFGTLRREHERRHMRTPPSEVPEMAYQITTLVIAAPEFNPERTDAGVFDIPPFVGPCVEFGLRLEIDNVSAVELERAPAADGATPAQKRPDRDAPSRPER